MYISLLNNLAIMIALLFIAGKFFETRPLNEQSPLITKVWAGMGAGILGTLLVISSIEVTDTVILDFRHQAAIIAAITGGPVSSIIASFLIGISRMFLHGISSTSLAVGSIIIIVGLILGVVSKTSYSKFHKYMIMNGFYILINIFMIVTFLEKQSDIQQALAYHVPFSILVGVATYYMIEFLRESNQNHRDIQYYKLIAENSTDVVSIHDRDGIIKYISPSSLSLLGYQPSELIGQNVYNFINSEDIKQITPQFIKHTSITTLEFRFLHKEGYYIWMESTFNKIKGEKNDDDFLYTSRDVTERKRMEQEILEKNQYLQEISDLDGLTEIPNRRSFDITLHKEWEKALEDGTSLSLLLFDIDKFKVYNDTYGHLKGDTCLKEVTSLTNSIIRKDAFFARYGGEEFAVILPNTSAQDAHEIAEMIRTCIFHERIPNVHSEVEPFLTISMGVTTIQPSHDLDTTSIIDQADQALYLAKEKGRNKVIKYTAETQTL